MKITLLIFVFVFASQFQVYSSQKNRIPEGKNNTGNDITSLNKKFSKQKESKKILDIGIFHRIKRIFRASTILLILLSFIIPPLSIYLYDGETTKRFWFNLGLFLLTALFIFSIIGLITISLAALHAIFVVTGFRFPKK